MHEGVSDESLPLSSSSKRRDHDCLSAHVDSTGRARRAMRIWLAILRTEVLMRLVRRYDAPVALLGMMVALTTMGIWRSALGDTHAAGRLRLTVYYASAYLARQFASSSVGSRLSA